MQKRVFSCVGTSLLLLAVQLLTACETVVFEEEEASGGNNTPGKLVISVAGTESYGDQGSTRTPIDVTKTCGRLCFAIYQDGTRVKSVNQKAGDSDFGTATFSLDAGEYEVLILGHNSNGNPSTTNPQKIQFTNGTSASGTGFSDTFYYYGDLSFDGTSASKQEFMLTRATAMFRLVVNDNIPSNVQKFYFYYTGGSGTLDATSGFGCVNSKQNAIIDVGTTRPATFELYTFPHEEDDQVTFTVKALTANDDIVHEREFKNVWMRRNTISQYSGSFFSKENITPDNPPVDNPPITPTASSWTIKADTVWAAVNEYSY